MYNILVVEFFMENSVDYLTYSLLWLMLFTIQIYNRLMPMFNVSCKNDLIFDKNACFLYLSTQFYKSVH